MEPPPHPHTKPPLRFCRNSPLSCSSLAAHAFFGVPRVELLLDGDERLLEALGLEGAHLQEPVLRGLEVEQVLLHVRAQFVELRR